MSKNIFSKAFDGLFGPGSPIPNEPTIDYNDTIHSFKSNPYNEPSYGYNYHNYNTDYSVQGDSLYGIRLNKVDYRSGTSSSGFIYDDSDDELNNDMSQVYNQFNENSSKLSNDLKLPGTYNSYDDNLNTTSYTRGFRPSDRFSSNRDSNNFTTDKFIRNRNVFKDDTLDLRYNNAGKSQSNKYSTRSISLSSGLESDYRSPFIKRDGTDSYGSRKYVQNDNTNDWSTNYPPKSKSSGYTSPFSPKDKPAYSANPITPRYSSAFPKASKYTTDESLYPRSNNLSHKVPKVNNSERPKDTKYHVNNRYSQLSDPTERYTIQNPKFGIYEDKNPTQNQAKAKEIIKLEQELNKESITKLNTKYNELSSKLREFQQLNKLNEEIEENNAVLKQLDELLDINNDKGIKLSNPNDDYNKLKGEYLKELQNHQYFYQNYIKLFDKYKTVKERRGKDLRKARMIRDSTTDPNVKKLCNEMVDELL